MAQLLHRTSGALAVLTLSLLAAPAGAQGNLSTHGFGYPPGQLSTRALGTGGALAEIDPVSPLNPAALLAWGGSALYFQAEPEFRTVRAGSQTERTNTARYPLTTGALAFGSRWVASLSASTLTDRTWATTATSIEHIGADTSTAQSSFRSEGAINDLRLALGFAPARWVRVGLGLHAYSGRNRLAVGRTFADSSFAGFSDTATVSYGGNAISAGVELVAGRVASAALSYRRGGRISAEGNTDSILGRGDIPDRIGLSVAYLGIANSTIALRASREQWSQIAGLGSSALRAQDIWDIGVGGDIAGPRLGQRTFMVRLGGRWRELPFQASGTGATGQLVSAIVSEKSISAGLGTSLAGDRASLDLGVVRAARSAAVGASERAWIFSVGLGIRP
jgi:hypothetical protein